MPKGPTARAMLVPERRGVPTLPRTAALAAVNPDIPASPPDDWHRVFAAIRTRKWFVLTVTLVGTLAGIVGSRVLKPTYQASATVWLEMPDPDARQRDAGPIASGQLLGSTVGWLDLLRSHVVLDDVVRQWRLYLAPKTRADVAALATFAVPGEVRPGRYRIDVDGDGRHFRLVDLEDKALLQSGRVGDSVGATLGFAWAPTADVLKPGGRIEFTVATTGEAAQKLAEELRVRAPQDGNNFVRIERRGPNPSLITGTVNTVAERFVAAAAGLKRERLSQLAAILKEQLDQAQTDLRTTEGALEGFRVSHAVRPSEGPAQGADGRRTTADPTYASYIDLQVAIGGLTHDREAIGRMLAHAADSGVAVDQLSMVGAVQRSPELTGALKELSDKETELRAMRYRYADSYPPVRRLAGQVDTLSRRSIPGLGRSLMAGLTARARELGQRADSIVGDLKSEPPMALAEVRLTRDQATAERLFSDLQHRYQEARIAEVSTLPDVRILERAVQPTHPSSNTAPLLIIVALFSSFALGAFGAVLLDRVDPKVRYPDEVSHAMGLPILGAVPHMNQRNGGSANEDAKAAVEALRGLRLNVQHAHGAAGPLLITVTSPGRGEGKSFITSNLAQAFADVGYRTLLVDGDVRLGALHRAMGGVRRPGLTDVLAGRVDREAVLQKTAHPRITFIGAGSRMHRGPELLCSDALPQLITAMRANYDVILVDSAPLAAGVDPYALGTATGNVLLVLRTGVSDRAIAEAKVEVLQRLPIRVLGVVLNDVRAGGSIYSYYAYSLTGYEIQDEDPTGVAGAILLPGRS
jgi:succinoglycan biosynthesis transport protein ExoP